MTARNNDDPDPDSLDADIAGLLGAAVVPVEIEPERAARMRLRAMEVSGEQVAVVRAAEGAWQATQLPGIEVRILHIDHAHGTQTALWRLGPGAYFPAHSHLRDEESLILSGHVVSDDGKTFQQGDFLFARAGAHHTGMTAPSGALLLVRNELTSDPRPA